MEDPMTAERDPVDAHAGRRGYRRLPGGAALEVVGGPDEIDEQAVARLVDKLAAALREVRGYVPHRVWWDAGAADALHEYQATRRR